MNSEDAADYQPPTSSEQVCSSQPWDPVEERSL